MRYPTFGIALLVLMSACTDTKTPTPTGVVAKDTKPVVQVLACSASITEGTVSCEPTAPTPASGLRLDQKVFGGQGLYVRLTSSGVAYNSGTQVFSFNVTAQNLTQSKLSTVDGTTRDDSGVRVFFAAAPVALPGGVISVANADGLGAFTGPNQSYFQYGGKLGGNDQPDLGGDGILSTAEVSTSKPWQLNVPASVTSFTFSLYVASEVQTGTLLSAAPQIDSIRPLTLVPGAVMSVYGSNFNATAANNVVNVGGVNVNGAAIFGTTQVSLVTPCVLSGSVPVKVTANGMTGVSMNQTLQAPVRTLGLGQTFIATSTAETRCNELAATGVSSKYLISVFSDNTSPSASDPYQISADPTGAAAAVANQGSDEIQTPLVVARGSYDFGYQAAVDKRHFDLLETNRIQYGKLKAHFAADKRMKYSRSMSMVPVPIDTPVVDRVIRLSNISPPGGKSICNSYYPVNAHRVYYNGKIAIYEDADSTPVAFKAASNPTMAAYYQKIGDQFNADMEPILKNNFGDVLRRDPVTDHNGVLIALFTPMINKKFSGVAGFVVSCDQFPNDSTSGPGSYTNSTSNLGEFFYAYQPVTAGTGYSGNTADNWYRTIRSTFIHESKHVVAFAARVENNAPAYELSAFEEGMARTSEEMWAREAVYAPLAFKGNTGYGSFANPVNVYCDVRPGFPECDANPRTPVSIMQRHFTSLYTNLLGDQGRLLSPFGPTASDNASYFYATAWSLLRYSADHYGASDAAFLTAMTQATTSGTASLTAITGAPLDNILGGWALAQSADDYPGLTFANSPVSQNPTWNWRNIYAGLNSDFPGTYTLPYPSVPTAFSFGTFGPSAPASSTMRGGGVVQYSISGTQTAPQLVRLENNGGGPVSSSIRVAIVRVQ